MNPLARTCVKVDQTLIQRPRPPRRRWKVILGALLLLGLVFILRGMPPHSRNHILHPGTDPAESSVQRAQMERLIDKLTAVRDTGGGFASLWMGCQPAPVMGKTVPEPGLVRQPQFPPELREIVEQGPAALPALMDHLRDPRLTMMKVSAMGMWYANEYDPRSQLPRYAYGDVEERIDERPYCLKVGDLCYYLVGQIVNRGLLPASPHPTAVMAINSPVHAPALAAAVQKDWGELTRNEHEESLVRDAFSGRLITPLLFYYPRTGETTAVKLLERRIDNSLPCGHPTTSIPNAVNLSDQTDVVGQLFWFQSHKVDQAIFNLYHRAVELPLDENWERGTLVMACMEHLIGRGHNGEFAKYCKKRIAEIKRASYREYQTRDSLDYFGDLYDRLILGGKPKYMIGQGWRILLGWSGPGGR